MLWSVRDLRMPFPFRESGFIILSATPNEQKSLAWGSGLFAAHFEGICQGTNQSQETGMAFNLVAGAWTREALKVPSIDRTGAGGVIGHVTAANYTGSSDTIFEGPPNGWRADRQNPSTTHANIQIQKNGVFNQK